MSRKKKREEEAAAAAPGFGDTAAPAPISSTRITPLDIQQKVFRSAVRGYHEREVDQFLDEVTEELARLLAETRSLREQLERAEMRPTTRFESDTAGAPGSLGSDAGAIGDAHAEASRMLAEARDEAARIVAEARGEAVAIMDAASAESGKHRQPWPSGGGGGPSSGRAPDRDFIHREREFLQNMAGLIQDHAEAIREDLKRVRGEPGGERGGSPTTSGSAAAAVEAPVPETADAADEEASAVVQAADPVPAVEPPSDVDAEHEIGNAGDDAGIDAGGNVVAFGARDTESDGVVDADAETTAAESPATDAWHDEPITPPAGDDAAPVAEAAEPTAAAPAAEGSSGAPGMDPFEGGAEAVFEDWRDPDAIEDDEPISPDAIAPEPDPWGQVPAAQDDAGGEHDEGSAPPMAERSIADWDDASGDADAEPEVVADVEPATVGVRAHRPDAGHTNERGDDEAEPESDRRSLRELFWGED